jgi:hypothetical protein
MDWGEAMAVLAEWAGRRVVVVPYMGPGMSLQQHVGPLDLAQPRQGVVQLRFPDRAIVLPRATFIEAGWVPGQEQRGLSVTQGAVRIDVFLDD